MKKMINWNDENQVLAAVSYNGHALLFVSPELKNNKKIVSTAVLNEVSVLQYAPKQLQNDRSFCSSIFKKLFGKFEIKTIKKSKLYDFKFNNNCIRVNNFKKILIKIF